MKIIFAILIAQTLTFGLAQAQTASKSEQRTCERLLKQAEAECDQIMCDDLLVDAEDGAVCERDGDFAEGFQICVYDDVLLNLVDGYNKRHPKKQVNCDDL